MADENKDLVDLAEFEDKPASAASRKDVWLFLIIVDVVFLCVFGFFLYKSLSARLLAPRAEAPVVAAEPEEVVLPQEEVQPVTENVPAAEPVSAPVPEEKPAAEEKPATVAPAPKAQPQPAQKESVIIKTNAKSQYRQVTFRYFGTAKEVAVVSGFTMAKPRAMKKQNGIWETTLAISPGTYKYLFVVDGKQIPDPYAPEQDGRSVLVVK